MTKTTKTPAEVLDRVTSDVTAFNTWEELTAACQTGYVPTVKGKTQNERRLIVELNRAGFNVWGNNGKNW